MKTVVRSAAVRTAPNCWFKRRIRKLSQAEPELKLLPHLCGSGSISIDVGANLGPLERRAAIYTNIGVEELAASVEVGH